MIFKLSERLLDDLKNELGALRLEAEDNEKIKKLETAVMTCIQYLTRLRKFFRENKPTEKHDLIRFFKTVKPQFKARLIFYQFILETEKNKPAADIESMTAYYLDQRKPLFHFFEGNRDFYRYMRATETYLDEQYFLPGVFNIHLSPDESIVDGDEEFTTSHDSKAARLIAHNLIGSWLEKTILKLNNKEEMDLASFIEEEMVVWTQKDTALVENIYGWKETGALNNGKISIARISRYMEKVFHVNLGNVSDTWNYICGRTNPTIYMDEMKNSITNRRNKKLR